MEANTENVGVGSDQEMVTEWLNNAAMTVEVAERLVYFHKLQEFLIRKSPQLLPKFVQNVINFAVDKSPEIRKALVGFIEELCKTRDSLIPKVMVALHMLLCDESVAVQKRVIQAAISIYRKTLQWLCKAPNITEEMETAWKQLTTIKLEIANMIDSDNDGIRTSAVKFLECVILAQTYPDQVENKRANDFSLDDVPLTLKIARRRRLEEEASNLFQKLLKFHGSPHISAANLLTCLGVLTNLAKNRAEFMSKIIFAIESLYENLPPTLTTTQVNSVKKKLKTELCGLVKHPAGYEHLEEITPILLELGCVQSEIAKLVPKAEDRKKYCKRVLSSESMLLHNPPKRAKIDHTFDLEEEFVPQTPQEANEKYVKDNLSMEKAVHLIITSIPKLPSSMPSNFGKEYGRFVQEGTVGSLEALAKVMAEQFTQAKVGPGAKVVVKEIPEEPVPSKKRERDREGDEDAEERDKTAKKERTKVPRVKTLKLTEITKPLEKDTKERLLSSAVKRLLGIDSQPVKVLHQKIVTNFASIFSPRVRDLVLTFLLSDLKNHIDTALSWLVEEYSIMQGFSRIPPLRKDVRLDQSYNNLLCTFVGACAHDAVLLSRLFLESPLVTEEALDQMRIVCKDEKRCGWALGLLRDLAIRKPPKQLAFLNVLLSYTTFESNIVRDTALKHVLELHKRPDLGMVIEEFARMNLEFLKLQRPPESLCGFNQGRMKSETWTDEFIKACLLPYVSLLPSNQSLIYDLARVYVQTGADNKRIILRLLDVPIKTMGMESTELLKLVEECPKGSETLILRIIHILTDKEAPSSQLVQIVRDLYNNRVSDVRFLIPVLNGLTKAEVIAALPKLIKINNPVVVKEVFNRLLGLHGESPITPTDLLVSLHLLDAGKTDLKTIIKATSMCLQEKQVYTQEVLAVVLQQLMDQPTIPTLLMRTVIQALGSYPRLSGFVMNILQRLILKQVWKQKVVWEGFIKCCQRTKPQSFAVLVQLPPAQLAEALTMSPELAMPLRDHLLNLTEGQRAHIPAAVQEVIMGGPIVPGGLLSESMIAPAPIDTTLPPPSVEPLPPGME